MADTETSGGGHRKWFDLQHPGAKEYAIAIGGALALYMLYKWWSNRNTAASSASTPSSTTAAPSTPTGLNTSGLMSWVHDFQSSPATATSATSKAVPNVEGMTQSQAVSTLQAQGFTVGTSGSSTGKVTSQTPAAGTTLTEGGSWWPSGGQPRVDVN